MYNSIIEQIHKEFNSASDRILEEENIVVEQKIVKKGRLLRLLGFGSAIGVKEADSVELKRQNADMVREYKIKYPFNKFITKKQVVEICKKYNLVCGATSDYAGFVPEIKLKEIKDFVEQNEYGEKYVTGFHSETHEALYFFNPKPLLICAPRNDFVLSASQHVKDFFVSLKPMEFPPFEDPIVLASVMGGYIIVSAWGDEASDLIVVNETHN